MLSIVFVDGFVNVICSVLWLSMIMIVGSVLSFVSRFECESCLLFVSCLGCFVFVLIRFFRIICVFVVF